MFTNIINDIPSRQNMTTSSRFCGDFMHLEYGCCDRRHKLGTRERVIKSANNIEVIEFYSHEIPLPCLDDLVSLGLYHKITEPALACAE